MEQRSRRKQGYHSPVFEAYESVGSREEMKEDK
jgi:hypothetical protein